MKQRQPTARSAWNADEYGMTPDDHREMAWGMKLEDDRQRLKALAALWLKPQVYKIRRDGVIEHRRNREEGWTFWRAVQATVAILLDRRGNSIHGEDLAYWDAGPVYGGYEAHCVAWCPGWRADIYDAGETCM